MYVRSGTLQNGFCGKTDRENRAIFTRKKRGAGICTEAVAWCQFREINVENPSLYSAENLNIYSAENHATFSMFVLTYHRNILFDIFTSIVNWNNSDNPLHMRISRVFV